MYGGIMLALQDGMCCVVILPLKLDPCGMAGWAGWPLPLLCPATFQNDFSSFLYVRMKWSPKTAGCIRRNTGWWFGTCFIFHWEFHPPNWPSYFFKGVGQPPTSVRLQQNDFRAVPWEKFGRGGAVATRCFTRQREGTAATPQLPQERPSWRPSAVEAGSHGWWF